VSNALRVSTGGLVSTATTSSTLSEVKNVLTRTLGIEDRADTLTTATPLLDSLPELDSMAVLNVILAIEEHFGVTIDGEEVTGGLFETLGTLSAFVERKLGKRA
jgi:acyl carrier protein